MSLVPWVVVGGGVLLVIRVLSELLPNDPPKVFVSFEGEDLHYKTLLAAWNKNRRFEFQMDEHSPTEPIDSKNAAVIKKALEERIKDSEYLLVIVGQDTHRSNWVNWEIRRAKEQDARLKLAAVKIDHRFKSPSELLGCGVWFGDGFTEPIVLDALKRASTKY